MTDIKETMKPWELPEAKYLELLKKYTPIKAAKVGQFKSQKALWKWLHEECTNPLHSGFQMSMKRWFCFDCQYELLRYFENVSK